MSLKNIFVIAADIKSAEDLGVRLCEVVLRDGRRYLADEEAGSVWEGARNHRNYPDDPFLQISLAERQGFFRRASNFLHHFRAAPRG